ncbi:MAG: hypothetical protein EG826_08375 [Deltaproteobacteria bacterium]|nr:hypothetical protein [Deltaproteobacteria bacterium]
MHWLNVVFVTVLLMSGLNIFNAHQALYWGKSSYAGRPPVLEIGSRENDEGDLSGYTRIFGRDLDTTGVLGASRNASGEWVDRGFPSWMTLPGSQWLALARRWHFFAAWLFVANGLGFVLYAAGSRHLFRDLVPTKNDWRAIGKTIIDHLRFRHPAGEASLHYNVLQKCAYLAVIFLLLPLMILMGLGMSPALNALFTGWVDLFAGRQSMRTLHFAIAWLLVLFVIVHVFMVISTGFWNNLRSMITGYYKVKAEVSHEG